MISDIFEREDAGVVEPPKPPSVMTPAERSAKMSNWRSRQEKRKTGQTVRSPASDNHSFADNKIAQALSKAKTKSAEKTGKKGFDYQGIDNEFSESEKIHIENLERLSKMTEQEIMREREEILGSMNVNVLKGLLRRAEIKDGGDDFGPTLDKDEVDNTLQNPKPVPQPLKKSTDPSTSVSKTNKSTDPQQHPHLQSKAFSIADVGTKGLETHDDDRYPSFEKLQEIERDLLAADEASSAPSNVHFPSASAPDLDPNSPSFLKDMHSKYFPNLDTEPAKMAWLSDIPEITELPDSLRPSELRFDFKGSLIAPRSSEIIPVTAGLHHHGDAPAAAGYTIAELAHLARSTSHGQRCLAIQTLGRVLYKLGKEQYGSEIGAGLWGLVDEARVVDSLMEASDEKKTKSVSVRAYAVEALWLWKQGGGGRPAI